MKKITVFKYIMIFLFCGVTAVLSTQSNYYYEGSGGTGIRIAVLQPSNNNLSEKV